MCLLIKFPCARHKIRCLKYFSNKHKQNAGMELRFFGEYAMENVTNFCYKIAFCSDFLLNFEYIHNTIL